MKTKGLPALAVVAILLAAVLAPAMGLSLLNNSNSSVNESENASITNPVPEPTNDTSTVTNITQPTFNDTMNESADINFTPPALALNLTLEPPKEIKELQQWIYKRGYNYTVAENWITRLSPDERKALCGYRHFTPSKKLLSKNMRFLSELPREKEEEKPKIFQQGSPSASYDAMALGYVTPVKVQGLCGSCWVFGAITEFESDVLINESQYSNLTLNFSEQEVGDCNIWSRVGGYNFCDGGNAYMTTNYFTKYGSANESCHPYAATPGTCSNCPLLKNVDNWRIITDNDGNESDHINTIKNAILTYGPVYSTIYASDHGFSDYESGVYEYWGPEETNHAVEIIGWNDSLGAWMIKNSWGIDWGASGPYPGCAWVAYGAANLGDRTSAISGYKNPDPCDVIFYHDECGWGANMGYGSQTAYGAVRFTPSWDSNLTAVDFWAVDASMTYEIKIFNTLNTYPAYYTFSDQLGTTQTGTTNESGYYSIPLNTPVQLVNGDDFIVQVKLTTTGYGYPLPIEDDGPLPPTVTFSEESYCSSGGSQFTKPSSDIGIRARAWYVAGDSTDTWESKLIGTFDDDTNDNFFAEILDSNNDVPNFDGTLTKYAIKVVVTYAQNLDEGDGIEFRHSNNGSTDAVTIGSISGTQLNTVGTYWVNSSNSAVLSQVEHNGVAQEWHHCVEIGNIVGQQEDLTANISVYFEYAPNPPQWSNPNTNKTLIYQNDYVKFTTNWTDDALAGYKFSINQTGTWVNSSFTSFSGTSNTSENVTQITATAGTTVQWRFYVNDTSDNWNATDIQSFVVATPPPPPSTPYMIYGWVFYNNGTACYNFTMNITNLNNSKQRSAKTNASYNYYRLMLANGTDLNASEILRFNVRDSSGVQFKIFNHTITEEEVNNGGLFNFNITIEAPETPFMIYGWVNYSNGTACLNPTVNITNTNTSTQWQAETNASYNFYQLILDTSNISTGNVLSFNATDGMQFNVTNHTVTQKNITDGSIFDFNLTIGIKEPVNIRNYDNTSDLDSWAFNGGMGENVTVSWQNSSNGTPTCVIWNSGPDGITVCIYAANFTDGDGVQFNPNATEKIVVRDDGNTTPIVWSAVTDYVSNKNESSSSWYNFTLEAGGVRDVYLQLCIPMNVKSGTYNSTFYAKKE